MEQTEVKAGYFCRSCFIGLTAPVLMGRLRFNVTVLPLPLHHTHVAVTHRSTHLQLTLEGRSSLLQGRGTRDAVHAAHLRHFATAGEAVADTVPRAGAVPSARTRVLAQPKRTAASVVLARKGKGLHGGASPI